MKKVHAALSQAVAAASLGIWPPGGPADAQETPRAGGELAYSVLAEPPSFDAHQEATFAVPHTTAPFYSLLVKFDPFEYPKIVPDLAESWTISPDGRVYEFRLRDGVKFHDGSVLTSGDVKASLDHVVFPPAGVTSPRKAVYRQVASVEAPNPRTVRVTLKQPSPAMLTFLASPWNYIYKADALGKDPHWYKKNVMGTGPFKLAEYVPGSHVLGKKNPDYFMKGLPYLDGFRALFIVDGAARVAALRGGRVAADFVGATPVLDQASLEQALGDRIVIQKSPWTCVLTIAFHHEKKPFDDPRVRRALSLALDRREAARVLNDFTEYGTVAGISQPGAPYAMPPAELEKVPGYWPDIEKSRAEARRLLKEAGVPDGFSFAFTNRGLTGTSRVGVYVIDQWRKIGLNATHRVLETGPYFTALRSGDFEASVDFSCDFADEPDLQLTKYLSSEKSPINYCRYTDATLDELFERQSREQNLERRKQLVWEFERRVLGEMAHQVIILGQVRAVAHWAHVKGWKVTPSHYLNQDLATVWLAR
ncbi:MAG: ABC transporter substrate-binding protein [Candidatus Rokuibacteriota bacterium]